MIYHSNLIKQVKRFLISEKVSYVEYDQAIYLCKDGGIVCFYDTKMPVLTTHLVRFVAINTLKEFIEEYRK